MHRRNHDDVIKWKHCPRHWPYLRGIHRLPRSSLHKCQWHETLMFYFTFAWTNGWVNNRIAGDLRRHPAHYDVTVKMKCKCLQSYLIHSTAVRVTHVMTHNLFKFQISTTISCPMLLDDKGLYKDSWYPWRSGGINDARNVLNASVMDSF